MNRFPTLAMVAIVLAYCLATPIHVGAQGIIMERGPVTVVLVAEAAVDESIIYLDQIAKISGGSSDLRRRIAKLDVAELKLNADQTSVSADQVRFRLLIAGVEPAQFKLTGAKRTAVLESDEPITTRKVLASAEATLRLRYPGDPSKAVIVPAKPIILPLLELRPSDRIQLTSKIVAETARGDKSRIDVSILVNGKTREVVPVHLESATLDERSPIAAKDFNILPVTKVIPSAEPSTVVIKTSDRVKIIVKLGAVRVEALGEAMQDGKLGDVIRVRNTESSRIVHGRIEANGSVHVEY